MTDHEQAVEKARQALRPDFGRLGVQQIESLIDAKIAAALAEYFQAGKSPPYSVPPIRDIIVEPAAARSSEKSESAGQREDRAGTVTTAGSPGVGTSPVDATDDPLPASAARPFNPEQVRLAVLHALRLRGIGNNAKALVIRDRWLKDRAAMKTDILREQRKRGGGA